MLVLGTVRKIILKSKSTAAKVPDKKNAGLRKKQTNKNIERLIPLQMEPSADKKGRPASCIIKHLSAHKPTAPNIHCLTWGPAM